MKTLLIRMLLALAFVSAAGCGGDEGGGGKTLSDGTYTITLVDIDYDDCDIDPGSFNGDSSTVSVDGDVITVGSVVLQEDEDGIYIANAQGNVDFAPTDCIAEESIGYALEITGKNEFLLGVFADYAVDAGTECANVGVPCSSLWAWSYVKD